MEILEVKTIQEKVKAYHETDTYSVEYDVILGENKVYQSINGIVKDLATKEIVGYINKSYELAVRTTNGKESLFMEVSSLAVETLALLDEEIKKF